MKEAMKINLFYRADDGPFIGFLYLIHFVGVKYMGHFTRNNL